MSHPLPASRQKDPTEIFLDEGQGWIVPRYIPKESESSQQHQNADSWSSGLLQNRVTALEGDNNVPVESDFWALHQSLENSKIVVLEWMTTAAQFYPSARIRRKNYMKLAEHVVKKGAPPPPEVIEAAANVEQRTTKLQQYCQNRFNAEYISSCEAYFEK